MPGRPQKRGPVAQLGARLNGIEEVRGSNPLRSTIFCALNRSSRLAKSITESRVAVEARYGWQSPAAWEGGEPCAPAEVVQKERQILEELRAARAKLEERLRMVEGMRKG